MDKYKRLMTNTLIFAIGTFSSKILSILLLPFYARVLQEGEYGNSDLIIQAANLLIPMVSLGISNAIIRYGLDKNYSKSDVFTGSICTVFTGYLIFLLLSPIVQLIPFNNEVRQNFYLIYIYVLTSSLRSLCAQFVRAKQFVKLYAFDGILATATVVIFNILFLSVFRMGVTGYVLATICSDFFSVIFLFSVAGLRRYINFRRMDWSVLGSMLRFSIPLIPANIFWWVTNVSDHYILTAMKGAATNDLYVFSYKIPTMISLVSGFFTDAWQMSAITENGVNRDKFYTQVFTAYQALMFTAASGLILFTKPITGILAANHFRDAWQFVPLLTIASIFSCFVTFLGSIYMVERKSVLTLLTTVAGAVINIILNIILIPKFGANGAAFATFCSYFVVFLLRIINTRNFVKIRWNPFRFGLNLMILLAQTWVLLNIPEVGKWVLYESILFVLMILSNLKLLVLNFKTFLCRRKPR